MKAWEIRASELSLREVEPVPPAEGETMVRVSHTGLCGSDLPKLVHPSGFALPEPWRPGHEIVGTDRTGRAVVVDPLVPCGTCPRCAQGNTHLCSGLRRLGWDLPGGLAEQVVVPTTNTHPLPDGLDRLHAVLTDPAAVAVHGLRCNPIGAPGRLAVIGAGTIGLLTALYAHRQGWEVTIVHRDGRAPRPVVADAVPAAFRSPTTLRTDETFGVVVDAATGADPAPLDLALRIVDDGGTIVVQNAYHPGVRLPTPLRDVFRRSIQVTGSFSHCRRAHPDDFTLALNLLRDHTSQMANLVTEAGRLTDLPTVLCGRSAHSIRQALAAPTS
ncbi:hypothetical protein DPM19_23325 [Actinomadura craniellae]|uniref:Alcohol dehydrogenase-like N-terminal domain-containing protein n=1 Tax=Actinomadura craniellae TaxID=2231787 RepID=A0A365H1H9_9ACTN|nr:alcohol dehydrogenase catalytic domain-containing protein [Actinomadura craniellae]RAY12942.1 hypothetical protein DPM19_23325 [Actinomadura craniellae]